MTRDLFAPFGIWLPRNSSRQAKVGMVAAFSGKSANVQKDAAAEIRELHAKIGELTVEKDFLERAFAKR